MVARKLVFGLVGISVLCSVLLLGREASAQAMWWHNQLSQSQRDFWIDNQAYIDSLNRVYGGECKDYARALVLGVSHQVVRLPSNCSDSTWCSDPNVVQVYEPWWGLYKGQIVQMRIQFSNGTYGPHTAVVDGIDLYGVWFIASNGPSAGGDGIVRKYYWTYDYLRAKVGLNYSVYDIK